MPARALSTYCLLARSVPATGLAALTPRTPLKSRLTVGAAIWSRRLVRTAVLKSEIVADVWVPVWLARANGSVASLDSAIPAAGLMWVLVMNPAGIEVPSEATHWVPSNQRTLAGVTDASVQS